MSDKLVLIDGNSIINRAFYGIPMLTNADGLHTNAVYGFLNIMFKILEEEQPDYLAIAFDLKAPTFRHKMYTAYKGTRKPMPEELREQVPVLKDLLKKMNICILELEGYEADDILGTMARRGEAAGMNVALVSGDRDLLQIATDKIMIRIPKTKGGKTEVENYYTVDVIEKYGLRPLQIIELKALMGDSSDNIPGVPKIGEKTATELLKQYDNIENLKEHIEEISKKSIKETLTNNYELAVLSKTLATICTEVPLTVTFEDTRINDMYTAEAYELIKSLEFKQILKRFEGSDLINAKSDISVNTVNDLSVFEELMNGLDCKNLVAFVLNMNNGEPDSISISTERDLAYHILFEGFISAEYAIQRLCDVIRAAKDTHFVTADLKQHMHHMDSIADIDDCDKFSDVIIEKYLCNPLLKDYSIDSKTDECASVVLSLHEELTERLKSLEMYSLYRDIEMPLVFCLYDMEKCGVLVKRDALAEYGVELDRQIEELTSVIKAEAGEDFNINSPKQLGEILFEKMAIPGGKKTKTGYSTSAEILEKLAPEYPFVDNILKYRGLAKLKSTYVDGLFPCIGSDGRIHSTFNQTVTATGRISSTEPNLQNIPVRMEQGRLIRKVFVPKEDCIFLDADYTQIELRIMAHMSADDKLISAYNMGEDIHRITASEVFHVPFEEVTSLQRRNAKAVNFGIIYGISSFGLSQDLSISVKEAKGFIEKYFETYPGVKQFVDKLVEDAKANGYANTIYGRRRPIPELSSGNFMQRSFGERVAMNAPIQGSAADIMKIAMINVYRRLKKEGLNSRIVLQVHDELLIETLINEQEQVKVILKEEMESAAKLRVALLAEMSSGNDWYEAK